MTKPGNLHILSILRTIPQLARQQGVPYSTLHRQINALWALDMQRDGHVDWAIKRNGRMSLNMSRLRLAHPELFDATIDEEIEDRVTRHVEQVLGATA